MTAPGWTAEGIARIFHINVDQRQTDKTGRMSSRYTPTEMATIIAAYHSNQYGGGVEAARRNMEIPLFAALAGMPEPTLREMRSWCDAASDIGGVDAAIIERELCRAASSAHIDALRVSPPV